MRRIILKEGPLVFLRNLFLMEFIAALFFFGISFLANYGAIYENWGLANYLRFDLFEVFLFSVFQVIYITLLFFDWYFTTYEINEKEVIRRSGLIFRRSKAVSLRAVVSIETNQSLLNRIMLHHATIIMEHSNGRITRIRNVSNIKEHVYVIKSFIEEASGRTITKDPRILIKNGESLYVEFKETMRYDGRKGEISKELEKVVLKTIVAFLNSEGGTLIIGVNDDGKVIGLTNDYKTLTKKNRDGFENHLTMLVKTLIGLQFTKYIDVHFEEIDGNDICIVFVKSAHKPAYLVNSDKKEDFFVRVGNSSQPFSMSEAEEYIKNHWLKN
ncbi:MAG: RNA-binding domain-containing protein [Candidatus Taylorbacteria bacterium]